MHEEVVLCDASDVDQFHFSGVDSRWNLVLIHFSAAQVVQQAVFDVGVGVLFGVQAAERRVGSWTGVAVKAWR